jgi:hypothetical protein
MRIHWFMRGRCFQFVVVAFFLPLIQAASDRFEVLTLDPQVAGGYQVGVADVDNDGRSDLITLGLRLQWLRNPEWGIFTISGDENARNIDLAPHDVDRDGAVDLVVAAEFSMENRGSGGLVQWFRQSEGSEAGWIAHVIDREPTAHRLRWADLEGNGQPVLVVAPIMGPGTLGPTYAQSGARLVFYRVPGRPQSDVWPKQLIDDTLPVLHGLLVFDWDGDGRDELLTASREGVHRFSFEGSGDRLRWAKTRLCSGNRDGSAAQGSSEVSVGRAADGRRFIATIEPWHGSQVVLYRERTRGELWERVVLDETLSEGHAILAMDLNGDSSDELYAGFRGGNGGIIRFQERADGQPGWDRTMVDDGGITCQGLNSLRLPDGRIGLLGVGGQSHNLRLYTPSTK